jgi:CRP/FNR family cyclic AMP-dependent transcriptional regulator
MSESQLVAKLEQFFQTTKVYSYKKRTLIFHPDSVSSSVFFIKSGYVRAYRITEEGEELTLTILKPKDFFPLSYGIHTMANPYHLEAITPLELWRSPQEQFVHFIKSNPDVFYDLTTNILMSFDGVLSRMENLLFCNAYIKVAATLLMCAKGFGEDFNGSTRVKVPLTHRDIATLVGITRETTSLEMKKLEKQGLLTKSGRFIIVKDLKRLESLTVNI